MNKKIKKLLVLFGLLSIIGLTFSCSYSQAPFVSNGGVIKSEPEGWVDKNTYQLWVKQNWDANDYYILEIGPQNPKKLPQNLSTIRETLGKQAYELVREKFRDNLIKDLTAKGYYNQRNSDLVNKLINSLVLNNDNIKVKFVKEIYTKNGVADILCHFKGDNLKFLIEDTLINLILASDEA